MKTSPRCAAFYLAVVVVMWAAGGAAEIPERVFCNVPDLGTGTGKWPPVGCSYISPEEVFMIIDGMPPGTTIELAPLMYGLVCSVSGCEVPGGDLGGTVTQFTATLQFEVAGTGVLTGFSRVIEVPTISEVHSAPRTPGQTVQTFDTDYYYFQGNLPPGDPDFASLQITGGTGYGYPSPGSTTMMDRPGGAFSVDSFFDVSYQIDFVGAPGGALDGLAGTTTATVRLEVERPPRPVGSCEAADNGTGTADIPPADCTYVNPEDEMAIIDGLPPGTTIELQLRQSDFLCAYTPCGYPGGPLGGEAEAFTSVVSFEARGTGSLAGYRRTLTLSGSQINHSAPRTPGDPIQHFPTEVSTMTASIAGDPDFAVLTFTAGNSQGLNSPGMTTIGENPDGSYVVDSFFDVSYRIDFVGVPGSVLEGLSGSTHGTVGIVAGVLEVFTDDFEFGDASEWSYSVP